MGDFQNYLEHEMIKDDSPYKDAEIEEERDYGDGKRGGAVEILLLTLNIGVELVKDLMKDYLKDMLKRKNNSATLKLKNDSNDELTISLNNLSLQEVDQLIDNFRGNVVEVQSL
ncbi:MAG: hypothetical protein JWP81_2120 [Ferruginibacter sp.]|nr:hypothetical protein [Ferruginibacter sp.]